MRKECCCNHCNSAGTSLAELPIGAKATIVGILPKSRGRKKLADVGIVPGTELLIEAHAPFGGLIRVKVMETSMALHKDEAACIMIEKAEGSNE
ncbi:MAG: ferrous iron transport protein A [Lentisphaerae bacterium]|nr:ferrous iron transport protein A [Lentisphaerota bacterium]